ncbi:amidohydrolase 2 [Mycolicibacterium canariasense]|uniref:6-methylsalicylate decarboxylase n=1 Tax=Mycolicibacterium canariasense TaxID=228230 RepID=A0A100W912_MYCCR|nr:amidohydrolase family protein [Mycolicibacterium canariasense]MCV7212861.1 amidohydrolase [Mycolicibacterium canariasense]ORV19264.1 amidohydrolase [Mycolicibacterium canariasense]GAS93833.1 amidohydrolase 2 [Mycolicibacterium canariasense]
MAASPNRIDVHTHFVPPFWGESLPEHGGDPSGWTLPSWDPDGHQRFMADNGIATSILSLTAPSVVGWPTDARRAMARRVNEYSTTLMTEQPKVFGYFATLPLPDVDGAVAEACFALDELHADGVVLLSSYDNMYLGDARLAPLWSALDQRAAVVFVHPGHPVIATLPGVPGPLVDYPFESTRTAVHMVFNGIHDKYPAVKIVLSHAGGFLPYAVTRFCLLQSELDPDGPSADDLEATFKRCYFDTALSSSAYALPCFLAFADPARILYGSDFPYAPAAVGTRFTELLDAGVGDRAAAINRENAVALFPRLA